MAKSGGSFKPTHGMSKTRLYRAGKEKCMKNGDAIRAMTDEELSEWIAGYALGLTGGALAMATEAWLEWLKQEANDAT